MPRMASHHNVTPKEVVRRLSAVYGYPAWRPHGDPMAELVLTVLSQNTSDANSGIAFTRLVTRFPSWPSLLSAGVEEIESAIQVGGLARIKAPRLLSILERVWDSRGSLDLSFLAEMPMTEAKEWLRALPGVGPKTAACVLLFSFGRPALPVDTHVYRVARRLKMVPPKVSADGAHDLLEGMIEDDDVYPFHMSLIKHGRHMCHARRPACNDCPLSDICPTAPSYLVAD